VANLDMQQPALMHGIVLLVFTVIFLGLARLAYNKKAL